MALPWRYEASCAGRASYGCLAPLHGWRAQARHSGRQSVLVTGELGIGQTTVVDVLLEQVVTTDQGRIGQESKDRLGEAARCPAAPGRRVAALLAERKHCPCYLGAAWPP
jgi:hypothetical protein